MAENPSKKIFEPAELSILLGPEEKPALEFYDALIEVTVDWSRGKATTAALKFDSRRDTDGRWSIQDEEVFVQWVPVRLIVHFGDEREEELMRGYIRQIKGDYPQNAGQCEVTVECQDTSIALDRKHIRKTWGGKDPVPEKSIISEIVSNHGLTMHSDSPSDQGRSLTLNQDETDIKFLKKRAEANDFELIFIKGELYLGPPRLNAQTQETILVYAGSDTNCISFDVDVDGHLPDEVLLEYSAQDGSGPQQETFESDLEVLGKVPAKNYGAGLKDFAWSMKQDGGGDLDELRAKAQQKANSLAWKIKAQGELDGDRYGHVLRIGEPVGVDGVGDWLGGVYYVDEVSHKMTAEGYRQSFKLIRNAFGDNLEAQAGALGPLAAVI